MRSCSLLLALILVACAHPIERDTRTTENRIVLLATGRSYVASDGERWLLLRPVLQTHNPDHATIQWLIVSREAGSLVAKDSGVWSSDRGGTFGPYALGWSIKVSGCGFLYLDRWPGGHASLRLGMFVPTDSALHDAMEALAPPVSPEQVTADIGGGECT